MVLAMKGATLYSFPFSCALAVDLVLRQHEVPFDTVLVKRGPDRKAVEGLEEVNPKRKVPTLVVEGAVLTEIVAVLADLDDRFVSERAPADRRRMLELCCLVATEIHQQVLGPLFDTLTPAAAREDVVTRLLPPVLNDIERALEETPSEFLLGESPSGADAYLYWAVILLAFHDAKVVGPATQRFRERMEKQAFVRRAVADHRAAMASLAS